METKYTVGNYIALFLGVSDKGAEHKICQITGTKIEADNTQKIRIDYTEQWYDLFSFEPIPLTEEWLLRFGYTCANRISMVFKLYHNEENSDNSLLALKEVGNNPTWVYSANNRWTINPFTIEIKYVHQLQNVWHIHTDNELKLIK